MQDRARRRGAVAEQTIAGAPAPSSPCRSALPEQALFFSSTTAASRNSSQRHDSRGRSRRAAVLRSRSRVGRRGRVRASVRSRPRTARGSSVDGRSTGDTVSTTLIEHEQRFRRIVSDYEYSSHPIVRAATAMPRGRDYALTERAWPGHEPRCRPARRAVRGLGQRARCRRRRGRPSAWRSAAASPATRACHRPRALAGSDAAPRDSSSSSWSATSRSVCLK